jgi:hypothetical protein
MSKDDRIDRRRALECMTWAGTGLLWSVSGGVPGSALLSAAGAAERPAGGGLSFVQISDSHIGFDRAANPDPGATLRAAVAQIRALPTRPAFVLHTGDISHLSREQEFDTAQAILSELGIPVHYVPGEHDVQDEATPGAAYLRRFGAGADGHGWYSFDAGGAHFVGLINVLELSAGGLGHLGNAQLAWLQRDLAGHTASTPIVVFAHMPLWSLYPEWGWGTDDSAQALALLRRFGSVTVLNGHIHQIMQKVEGQIAFHTARSTAFPQPAPGTAAGPGPLAVPADRLRSTLGIRSVRFVSRRAPGAVTDSTLA